MLQVPVGWCIQDTVRSNDILIELIEQAKTWVTENYKFIVLLKTTLNEKRL